MAQWLKFIVYETWHVWEYTLDIVSGQIKLTSESVTFFLRVFISKSLQGQKWPHNWRALVHRWSHIALFWQIYLFVYLNLVSITFSCNNVFFSRLQIYFDTTINNMWKPAPIIFTLNIDLSTVVISYTQRHKLTCWIYERAREKETSVHRVYSK